MNVLSLSTDWLLSRCRLTVTHQVLINREGTFTTYYYLPLTLRVFLARHYHQQSIYINFYISLYVDGRASYWVR